MNLQDFLPYKLSILSNKISAGIANSYKEQHGISIPEWRVLAILSNTKQLSAKQLSFHSQMDKVRISRTVKKLELKTMVEEKINNEDARSKIYRLTKSGKSLIKSIKPNALSFEKQLLEAFSDEEIKLFNQCLETLNQQADKITNKKG